MASKRVPPQVLAHLLERQKVVEPYIDNCIQECIKVIVRKQRECGLNADEFASVLGIGPSTYYRNWKQNVPPTLKMVLSFCSIFGYDFESLLANTAKTQDNDDALLEVAARMGGLSDTTLRKIELLVKEEDASPDGTRNAFCEALHTYRMKNQELQKEYELSIDTVIQETKPETNDNQSEAK